MGPEVATSAGGGPRSFVVDASGTVVESNVPELGAGDVLTASSWLGDAALVAIHAAVFPGNDRALAGQDYARGTHWLVSAEVLAGEPWRARVVAIDATIAVAADRGAILAKLVHLMQNVTFAMRLVVENMESDRPQGAALDEYLSHLRDPVDRMAVTATHLATYLASPPPALKHTTVDSVVESALLRVTYPCFPSVVAVREPRMTIAADPERLADTIAAMLESGGRAASPALEIDRARVDGRDCARVIVERRAIDFESREPACLWDLAGGRSLDVALRLTLGRAVVLAHGGTVLATPGARDRVRLGLCVPLVNVD